MSYPQLPGYEIKKEFAAGGMANIYDGVQTSLNRPVAIKFLNRKLLSHPEAKELFDSESLIIAKLNHPNIVQVIDKGVTENSQPYFVMEKLIGIDLSEMLAQGELPFNKKIDIALQLCKGLAYAHRNGVIHRDIKPSNIIIDQHGNVKILDFGIAQTEYHQSNNQQSSSVMGTSGYVAPEQQEDYSNATFASDIFSVGKLFSELFRQTNTKSQTTAKEYLPKNLPEDLNKLINKCSHPSVSQRYQSLNDVRDELLKISKGSHLSQLNLQEVQQENKDLVNNFVLLDVLSKSVSKRVYLFQKKSNHQLLVIKRTTGDHSGLKQAKYLSSLQHPNIIRVFAAAKSHNDTTLITEYLSGGSLNNQLIKGISEQKFLLQACQICSAIHFAHQNNILHSNLSPNNILFDDKKNIKLCDFGQTTNSNDNPQLSRMYQPPANQGFSEQYDIFCMGAVFYHMLYGVPPGTPVTGSTSKISFRLQKLIDKMMSINPLDRPVSAKQVQVELQRIANSTNKRVRSKIGQPTNSKKDHKAQPKLTINEAEANKTKWLSLALFASIVLIILLITKDFL